MLVLLILALIGSAVFAGKGYFRGRSLGILIVLVLLVLGVFWLDYSRYRKEHSPGESAKFALKQAGAMWRYSNKPKPHNRKK